jgi:outer membrane protein OmpA-like peptidoglycan-associated protein
LQEITLIWQPHAVVALGQDGIVKEHEMRMRWINILVGVVTLALLAALQACTHHEIPNPVKPQPGPACQVLLAQQAVRNQLESDGTQVVQVGEETTLILPADNFFYKHSNHMLSQGRVYLNHIISFLNQYPIVDLQVTGYTDSMGDPVRNYALSRAQAQQVANYLWAHGLNARLVTAEGEGGCVGSIASDAYCCGRTENRRIEIYFRQPPPNNVFH